MNAPYIWKSLFHETKTTQELEDLEKTILKNRAKVNLQGFSIGKLQEDYQGDFIPENLRKDWEENLSDIKNMCFSLIIQFSSDVY